MIPTASGVFFRRILVTATGNSWSMMAVPPMGNSTTSSGSCVVALIRHFLTRLIGNSFRLGSGGKALSKRKPLREASDQCTRSDGSCQVDPHMRVQYSGSGWKSISVCAPALGNKARKHWALENLRPRIEHSVAGDAYCCLQWI